MNPGRDPLGARTAGPYRGSDDDVVYRRSSSLAKWAPTFATAGVILLGLALGIATRRFPWDPATKWILMGLATLGASGVLMPSFVRRRLEEDPSLVDPSGDVRRAERVARVGITALSLASVFVVFLPLVFMSLWILGLALGVFDWPFG